MKIYKLTANLDVKVEGEIHPWSGYWDKTLRFIIRAKNENQARQIALDNDPGMPWDNTEYVLCEEITHQGEPSVIMQEYTGGY